MDNWITFDTLFENNARRFRCQAFKMNIGRPDNDFFQEGLIAMWTPLEVYQPDHDPLAIYFTCMIRNYLTDLLTGKLPAKKSESLLDATTNGSHRHSAISRPSAYPSYGRISHNGTFIFYSSFRRKIIFFYLPPNERL